MALIVSPYAPGAISDYNALVAAVRDMMDDDAYPQARIDRCIRLAESHFNRELRTPEMEKRTLFTVNSEITVFPVDCIAIREIYSDEDHSAPLHSMDPASLVETYGGQTGNPIAYAIEGRSVRIAPVGDQTLGLIYYASIPPLTNTNTGNWLLTNYPDLYLWGTLLYCCQADRDSAGTAQATQAVSTVLDSISSAAKRNRWGAGPLRPMGIRQVRSARA